MIFPICRVTHKGLGEGGTVHTWWVQQFCDIFGKKGDAWHMVLGDNPAGHGFQGMHPPPAWGRRGIKNFRKVFAWGIKNFNFDVGGGGGVYCRGGEWDHVILK